MREIIFRGKQNEGKWVEGSYFKHDTVKVCFSSDDPKPRHLIIQDGFCDWGFEPPIHCVDVDPETVGQYTGLIDKNGKKIFEGDICRFREWSKGDMCWVGKVHYEHEQFVIEGEPNKECETPFLLVMSRFVPKNIEIIGNIHDNPELLNGKGEGECTQEAKYEE